MKVNSVFNSNIPKIFSSVYPKKYTAKIDVITPEEKSRNSKTLYALSMLGIVSAALIVGAKNGITPKSVVQNTAKKITMAFRKKYPPKDPVFSIIGQRRDASALREYEVFIARKKRASLMNKMIAGDFNKKPSRAFDSIMKNNDSLQQQIQTHTIQSYA